jgi:hypothetical protein
MTVARTSAVIALLACTIIGGFWWFSRVDLVPLFFQEEHEFGREVVRRAEEFKQANGRLPDSLEEIGFSEGGEVSYQKTNENLYVVSFYTVFSERVVYYSSAGEWETTQ